MLSKACKATRCFKLVMTTCGLMFNTYLDLVLPRVFHTSGNTALCLIRYHAKLVFVLFFVGYLNDLS